VSIVTFLRPPGQGYFPTWAEIAVSLGIVSCCALVFLFFVERLKVYEEPVHAGAATPSHDAATVDGLLPAAQAAPRRYSLVAITAATATLLFLPVTGVQPPATPVSAPRAVEGVAAVRDDANFHRLRPALAARTTMPGADEIRLLTIDGNRDGPVVLFNHDGHMAREGGAESCATCHHLDLPFDHGTACSECHRDMYEPTPLFRHQAHIDKLGGNQGCVECHDPAAPVKELASATACAACHVPPAGGDAVLPAPPARWRSAPGYMDAMHGLCIGCHERRAQQQPLALGEALYRCDTCHDADTEGLLELRTPARIDTAAELLLSSGGSRDR
jgi:hypothetical protein